jgi:hypothetical protein
MFKPLTSAINLRILLMSASLKSREILVPVYFGGSASGRSWAASASAGEGVFSACATFAELPFFWAVQVFRLPVQGSGAEALPERPRILAFLLQPGGPALFPGTMQAPTR